MESPAGLSTGESCAASRFGSVPRTIAWTASTLCSSGPVKRVEAPASLPRGLEAEPFDQPLAVVANSEVAQRRLQFFEVSGSGRSWNTSRGRGDAQAGGGVRPESTEVFANGLA